MGYMLGKFAEDDGRLDYTNIVIEFPNNVELDYLCEEFLAFASACGFSPVHVINYFSPADKLPDDNH